MRLIDADALIDFFSNIQVELGAYRISFKAVNRAIDAQPTIEPKHGKWVYDMNQYYKCTNCGHLTLMPDSGSVFVPDWDEYHFCPNCGADMRKGADDE